MVTYTFESSDEGFTLTGNGNLQHTFVDYDNLTTGQSDVYLFEFSQITGYEFNQSINSYTTMVIIQYLSDDRIPFESSYNDRKMLQQVDLVDVYSVRRFRGEINK